MSFSDDERWEQDLRYQPWTLLIFLPTCILVAGGVIYVGFFLNGDKKAWMIWGVLSAILFITLFVIYFMELREIGFTRNKRPAWLLLYGIGSILAVACVWAIFERHATLGDRCKAGGVLCSLLLAGLHLKPMINGR